eukprot:scaffold46816_cov66-Phaeocystis_antarctica.AAC.5
MAGVPGGVTGLPQATSMLEKSSSAQLGPQSTSLISGHCPRSSVHSGAKASVVATSPRPSRPSAPRRWMWSGAGVGTRPSCSSAL